MSNFVLEVEVGRGRVSVRIEDAESGTVVALFKRAVYVVRESVSEGTADAEDVAPTGGFGLPMGFDDRRTHVRSLPVPL
jgi:hypothetical protein